VARTKIERAAWALSRSGAGALLRRLPSWHGVLTLCFHRIGDANGSAWEPNLWDATVTELDETLGFLRRHVDLIAPQDLLAIEQVPRGRHVLLTFDDGYREWSSEVLPVLRHHGVSAAFFLSTGFIDSPRAPWWYEIPWMVRRSTEGALQPGEWISAPLQLGSANQEAAMNFLLDTYKSLPDERTEAFLAWIGEQCGSGRCDPLDAREDWLSWDGARELRDAGMEIGGHTVDHPVLAWLPPSAQRAQIVECKRRIEDELERPMRMFSYPIGQADSFDAETRALLREEGVRLAFSYRGGYARGGRRLDPLDVPRVTGGMEPLILRAALTLPQAFARW
jgi:peptidoglycan/xylan/chitin deacetylase (PgdA/CDA1 family)